MGKIFIGFSNTAGVGIRLKNGFQKNGFSADLYLRDQHPYGYDDDKFIVLSKNSFIRKVQSLLFLLKMCINYDVIIYVGSGTGLFSGRKELKVFRFLRKRTAILYVGCDVRIPDRVSKYKWNTCINCPPSYKEFVGCVIPQKIKQIRAEENLFNYIFSPHECAGFLRNNYFNILWPVDTNKLLYTPLNFETKRLLRIFHAPSNQDYKGSVHIFNSINQLQNLYQFEFVTKQNIPIGELYREIANCDIVIDQMLGGFYGLLAIEAMAMGRPVICYLREENLDHECPIINANPDTLSEVLEGILSNPNQLIEIGKSSRLYVEKYHSDIVVSKQIIDIITK